MLIRIEGDNGRTRWFSADLFLEGRDQLPTLQSWEFEDSDFDRFRANVEVNLTLSDGSQRWSLFMTPTNLSDLLSGDHAEPAIQGCHFVVVSELSQRQVNAALQYLQQQGRLLEASRELV